jgi:exopolysaccharide biosynthesis polyprenyl glycosylphosphotransferase
MARRSAILLAWLPFLVDATLVVVALRLSYWLRFESGFFAAPKGTPPLEVYLPAFGFMLVILLLSLHTFGLYRSRSERPLAGELLQAFKAVTAGAVLGMAATFLYRDVSFSRLLFFQAWALLAVFVLAGRFAVRRAVEAAQRSGWGVSRVVLVGWGKGLRRLHDAIHQRPALGYHLVGWVGPEDDCERPAEARYLGSVEQLRTICDQLNLDGVLASMPLESHGEILKVIHEVDGLGVEIRFVPDMVELMSRSARVSEVAGIPLIGLREFPMRPLDRVVKRIMDVVLSVVGLILLAPLFAGLALIVGIESGRPVFYRQRRVGRDGRAFVMYKFRSMGVDAEENTGPVWARDNDTRVTRVGRHLRRLSLDELPQLLNVFRGEMSLVGPRPEREFFVRQFQTAVPRYLDRHRVKSGMTGWAQVHGLRGNTSVEDRTEFDIYYAENWSVALDFRILWLTVRHLLSGGSPRRERRTKPLPGCEGSDIVATGDRAEGESDPGHPVEIPRGEV